MKDAKEEHEEAKQTMEVEIKEMKYLDAALQAKKVVIRHLE